MNRIFTIIKAWLMVQMGMFTKVKAKALQEEPSTQIDSSDMQMKLEETIEPRTLIIDDELDENIVNEPLDSTNLVDTISTPTTIPQQQLNQDPHSIIQQDIPLLYDGKYDQHFNTPNIPVPMSDVNEEIWDVISNRLREDYVIPSDITQIIYQNN